MDDDDADPGIRTRSGVQFPIDQWETRRDLVRAQSGYCRLVN